MNNVSPRIATPRFTRPQHGRDSDDGLCSYRQKALPDLASSATTVLGASVRYMMPSTTSGVVSNFSSDWAWNTHCSSKSSTLPASI